MTTLVNRMYRHRYAPLFAFLVLVAVSAAGHFGLALQQAQLTRQQHQLIATQRLINVEQHERIIAVCDAITRSDQRLARAMDALIDVADAEPEVEAEFRRRAGLDQLKVRPPECERVSEPLPGRVDRPGDVSLAE